MTRAAPLVSIVISTYNRSRVLRSTMESVFRQTVADWELLVIGDACTDDTENAVHSFADPRVRFINMARNCGEQSGPNNEGLRLSRGSFIAFLNHDDLWFSDHLHLALGALGDPGTDMVFTMASFRGRTDAHPTGITATGLYQPHLFIPASSWVLRRNLAERVGSWTLAARIHAVPSEEWIHRAYRLGAKIASVPRLTVLAFPSGQRPGSYRLGSAPSEQEIVLEHMKKDEPTLRIMELERLLAQVGGKLNSLRPARLLLKSIYFLFLKFCAVFRTHPSSIQNRVLHGSRGGLVNALRRIRGLSPLPRP